jgi:hypothetical protein
MAEKKHSRNYEKVKNFYDRDLWNKYRVWMAVHRWITVAEFEEITGEPWDPDHKPDKYA